MLPETENNQTATTPDLQSEAAQNSPRPLFSGLQRNSSIDVAGLLKKTWRFMKPYFVKMKNLLVAGTKWAWNYAKTNYRRKEMPTSNPLIPEVLPPAPVTRAVSSVPSCQAQQLPTIDMFETSKASQTWSVVSMPKKIIKFYWRSIKTVLGLSLIYGVVSGAFGNYKGVAPSVTGEAAAAKVGSLFGDIKRQITKRMPNDKGEVLAKFGIGPFQWVGELGADVAGSVTSCSINVVRSLFEEEKTETPATDRKTSASSKKKAEERAEQEEPSRPANKQKDMEPPRLEK